jgi:hypothetical protein
MLTFYSVFDALSSLGCWSIEQWTDPGVYPSGAGEKPLPDRYSVVGPEKVTIRLPWPDTPVDLDTLETRLDGHFHLYRGRVTCRVPWLIGGEVYATAQGIRAEVVVLLHKVLVDKGDF